MSELRKLGGGVWKVPRVARQTGRPRKWADDAERSYARRFRKAHGQDPDEAEIAIYRRSKKRWGVS